MGLLDKTALSTLNYAVNGAPYCQIDLGINSLSLNTAQNGSPFIAMQDSVIPDYLISSSDSVKLDIVYNGAPFAILEVSYLGSRSLNYAYEGKPIVFAYLPTSTAPVSDTECTYKVIGKTSIDLVSTFITNLPIPGVPTFSSVANGNTTTISWSSVTYGKTYEIELRHTP